MQNLEILFKLARNYPDASPEEAVEEETARVMEKMESLKKDVALLEEYLSSLRAAAGKAPAQTTPQPRSDGRRLYRSATYWYHAKNLGVGQLQEKPHVWLSKEEAAACSWEVNGARKGAS